MLAIKLLTCGKLSITNIPLFSYLIHTQISRKGKLILCVDLCAEHVQEFLIISDKEENIFGKKVSWWWTIMSSDRCRQMGKCLSLFPIVFISVRQCKENNYSQCTAVNLFLPMTITTDNQEFKKFCTFISLFCCVSQQVFRVASNKCSAVQRLIASK